MYYRVILGILAVFLLIAYIDTNSLKEYLADTKILREYKSSSKMIGLGLKNKNNRIMVTDVLYSTPAQKAGLETGDEIISVDGENVSSPEMLKGYLQNVTKNKKIALKVKKTDNTVVDLFLLPTLIKYED